MADGGGWIGKYGVPSVIVSIAAFALQQQQQTFDRLQHTIEDGYQFYASSRKPLQFSEDIDRELSLLKIVGNAFPNIYCDVREDMFERASAAQSGDVAPGDVNGKDPIDSTDLSQLRQQLLAADRPGRPQFPENLMQAWTQFGAGQGKKCPALNEAVEAAEVVHIKPGAASPTSSVASATPPPPAAPAPRVVHAAPGARTQVSATAIPTEVMPHIDATPTMLRVFFHIPADGNRDPTIAASARNDLASFNYRVVRGVERIPSTKFPSQPEVRYFGPGQAVAAEQLARYLDWQFRDEKLYFRTRAIGGTYPGMPWQNIEVWVPNHG